MLGSLFLNADTKVALRELDKALQGEHGMAFAVVGPQIAAVLKHKKGEIAPLMRQRGLSYELLVLALAKRIVDRELPSGGHHIYRGALSQKGEALWDLYQHAVRTIWAADPPEGVSADEEIGAMKAEIAKVG